MKSGASEPSGAPDSVFATTLLPLGSSRAIHGGLVAHRQPLPIGIDGQLDGGVPELALDVGPGRSGRDGRQEGVGPQPMTLRALCRNLVGIPSFHYDPLFARAVVQAIRQARPEVIALELPEWLGGELDWALGCWPTAVGSITTDLIVPWIPGDSMLEACRLARQLGIPVHLVRPGSSRAVRGALGGAASRPRVCAARRAGLPGCGRRHRGAPEHGRSGPRGVHGGTPRRADASSSPGAVGGRHGALDATCRTARTG